MEYHLNESKAISELKESFTEVVFNSLPEEIRNKLIEQKRVSLDREWELELIIKTQKRVSNSSKMTEKIKEIEKVKYITSYHRFQAKSLGFQEDSLLLNNPELLVDNRIISFPKETILGLKDRIIETITDANSFTETKRDPTSYMYFRIFTNGIVSMSTRSFSINLYNIDQQIDKLYENFNEKIVKIKTVSSGYEPIFSTDEKSNVVFYFTSLYFPSPKSILFWGEDIPEIIHRESFDIFTASKLDVDCIRQCAEFLESGLQCNTLQEIFDHFGGQVCVLTLKSHIDHILDIKNYSDLIPHKNSPIQDISVINPEFKYLLSFNEHVGVIFDLKKQRKDRRYTTYNPLTINPYIEKITVCFDIECYFDPKVEKDQKHIPYLCCACFIYNDTIGDVLEFEGKNCVSQMIEYITIVCNAAKRKSVELIAHNGGNYDFHYIISSIYNPSIIKNILVRNNSFISFSFNYKKVNFSVKDSYSFLLCSLSNAAKAFLGTKMTGKTDFPHHEVRTKDDLERVFNQWSSVDNVLDVNIEKEKMIISIRHVIKYSEDERSKKLIDWAKEYCVNDVIVLANVWREFKNAVSDIFNSRVADQTYTLAGMSFKLFEAHLDSDIKLFHPNKDDYLNMRKSLIGGRCISINGLHEDIYCLDVKSLYPAAMAYYDQPYGSFKKVYARPSNQLGIYYVKVSINSNAKSNFFPIRYESKTFYGADKNYVYEDWYTTVDIDIGLEEGHSFEYISFNEEGHVGYSWSKKGKIFKHYIENVLYKLKNQYEAEGNKVKRQVIKIIMNSLWGKFAQKWIDLSYKIKSPEDVDFDKEEAYQIWETDYMLIKTNIDKLESNKPVQNGVFTLSWARYHMKVLWDACAKSGAQCIYSDTDSMCINKSDLDINATFNMDGRNINVIGNELGQLELEHEFFQMVCVGKKQYLGSYYEDNEIKYKKRFKGVPLQYITPNLYTHLLENKVAQINFLKFRREWGSVRGYIESKNVRSTM